MIPRKSETQLCRVSIDKEPDAIKDCIRRNEHVSLTLYRDGMSGEALRAEPRTTKTLDAQTLPLKLALPGVPA